MKKYPVALFIGRFQPFHKGHWWEVEKALGLAEKIIIGIGSSNLSDEKNPYSAEKRRAMIEQVVEEKKIGERVAAIVDLPDTTDKEWVENVKRVVSVRGFKSDQVIVIGNNDWVNDLLEQAGFVVHQPGFFNREELEGAKIREMMRRGDEGWKQRLPIVFMHKLI